MAQDSEKRFHSIMDKIFQSPPKPSSSPGGRQLFRPNKKRQNPYSALPLEEPPQQHCFDAAEAPLCRPWDRGDLMKRLSTFKSMTWFAKPKVVSALNCARRGWVNVDMDIIACQSCGARLLFSTPPSWTQQQVEKAALVFSLKLDNGHKMLCPWINNACDERLAEFPPMMPAELVDTFRERFSLLFQLLALPVISSSAIEFMKSPELEEFLRQPLTVHYQKENADFSQSESIDGGPNVDSAHLYYQAQKLISLCGWEPRSLPYVVDCKNGPTADILNSSQGVDNGQNPCLTFHSHDENDKLGENKDSENSCRLLCDPNSVVLDCRLCGASVGLWAYDTVQRPVEFVRLVGYAEVNPGVLDSGHESNVGDRVLAVAPNGETSSMTIAGGPPPTRQNFKATISLPVIGQSLWARLSDHPEVRYQISTDKEDTQSQQNCNMNKGNKGEVEQVVPLDDMTNLNSKRDDQVNCNKTSNDQSHSSNQDVGARDDIFRNLAPLEGTGFTAEEASPGTGKYDSNRGGQIESSENVGQGSCQSNGLPENVDNDRSGHLEVTDAGTLQVGESSVTTQGANVSPRNAGSKDNDSSVAVRSEKSHPEQIADIDKVCNGEHSSSSHQESACVASGLEADVNVDDTHMMNSREDKTSSDAPNANNEEGVVAGVQTAQNNKVVAYAKGKDLKQLHTDKITELDPIRQHRHFCPWIASTGGRKPGWQQTLSALVGRKGFPDSSPTCSPSSASVIKVDDPIASVRKLFTSPIAKRMKKTRESS